MSVFEMDMIKVFSREVVNTSYCAESSLVFKSLSLYKHDVIIFK